MYTHIFIKAERIPKKKRERESSTMGEAMGMCSEVAGQCLLFWLYLCILLECFQNYDHIRTILKLNIFKT